MNDWLIDHPWIWWGFIRKLGLGSREDTEAIAELCAPTGDTVNSGHLVSTVIECGRLGLDLGPAATLASDTSSSPLPRGVRAPASKLH